MKFLSFTIICIFLVLSCSKDYDNDLNQNFTTQEQDKSKDYDFESTCATCCSSLSYSATIVGLILGEGECCVVEYEMIGEPLCLEKIKLSFDSDEEKIVDLDSDENAIRIIICESNTVTFMAKDIEGNTWDLVTKSNGSNF